MELSKEQKLIQTIVNEAWENEAFKQELISNPIKAIEKLTGEMVQLPEGKQLVVRDQTDENTIHINIPQEQNLEDVELDEEQLEAVAGGRSLVSIWLPQVPPICTLPWPVNPGEYKAPVDLGG